MITKEQAFGMYIGRSFICEALIRGYHYKIEMYQESTNETLIKDNHSLYWKLRDFKLILRPFSDMDDIEMSIYNSKYKEEVDTKQHYKLTTNSIEYLISIGIDVFNLRDRGWAVYKSDIKETTK